MCYKLTSIYGIAHGHAAILCDRVLYPWMIEHVNRCIDPRGQRYLVDTLDEIGQAMGCRNAKEGAEKLEKIFISLKLDVPEATDKQIRALALSVNPVRLKNHPIKLGDKEINKIYHKILR